jgi:diaminopimelate epimerase
MNLPFCKYQGAGNDFILIDNRSGHFSTPPEATVAFLCNRHFGIGADGLMLLEPPSGNDDFTMRYYNSDGREGSMCGNGGRCMVAFARRVMTAKNTFTFRAVDGLHTAEVIEDNGHELWVRLKMADVTKVEKRGNDYFLDTGSPHLVRFIDDGTKTDIVPEARTLRHNAALTGPGGANINFVWQLRQALLLRTYERGVEDETLACGTGAVAAAIAVQYESTKRRAAHHHIELLTRGGVLHVDFTHHNGLFTDVWLAGPACFVFEGSVPNPTPQTIQKSRPAFPVS